MSVALAEYTSVRTGELENGGTPEGYECEGASGGGENGAERGGVVGEREATGRVYTGSDDEDSSVLEDLRAMFPLLDEEVLTTVLQTHEGRVEGAIDYLMAMNSQQAEGVEDVMPEPALQSFSEDIGGLPELIPSFVDEDDEDEEEFDPLPSYDEICPPLEPGPPPYSPPSQDHPFLRNRLADNFSLPRTIPLPRVDSPSLAPSRDPLQRDSPTLLPSMDPPQIDSPTLLPSMDPPQIDSRTLALRRDPPQTASPSRDPPQTASRSRDPPQADCTTMPGSRDPQADSPTPIDPSLAPNGDQQLQDISSSIRGGTCSSSADTSGRCQCGSDGFEKNVSLRRSGTSEQACNGDISSDEDFDHREGE